MPFLSFLSPEPARRETDWASLPPGRILSGRPLWRQLLLVGGGAALILVGVGLAVSWRIATHNEGVVVPGELYRAAQLNGSDLRDEVMRDHIRSVINLRGANPKSAWYVQERATCLSLGLAHTDIPLSARHLPRPSEMASLIEAYRLLPRPILIHCSSGSDRTGFAGAVYLIACKGLSPLRASQSLTWHFGHVGLYPYFEMDEFFQLYAAENPHHRSLPDWVRHDYPGVYAYEETETTWHEMLEPFDALVGIAYWRPGK